MSEEMTKLKELLLRWIDSEEGALKYMKTVSHQAQCEGRISAYQQILIHICMKSEK